jgi:hypothetical protein
MLFFLKTSQLWKTTISYHKSGSNETIRRRGLTCAILLPSAGLEGGDLDNVSYPLESLSWLVTFEYALRQSTRKIPQLDISGCYSRFKPYLN